MVQTSSTITTRAPFSRKPSMRCPVPCCFSALRTRKPCSSPLTTETATTMGSAPMVRPPIACGFHPRCRISSEKHLAGQARALGVKSRGAAVDVVVAGAARRELELAQPERLVGEQAQQILARGMHEILRYHWQNRPPCRAVGPRLRLSTASHPVRRDNLNILPQRRFEV